MLLSGPMLLKLDAYGDNTTFRPAQLIQHDISTCPTALGRQCDLSSCSRTTFRTALLLLDAISTYPAALGRHFGVCSSSGTTFRPASCSGLPRFSGTTFRPAQLLWDCPASLGPTFRSALLLQDDFGPIQLLANFLLSQHA